MSDSLGQGMTTQQTLALNFEVSERRKGKGYVSVQPDDDPVANGMDLLFPKADPSEFAGFPLCNATVQSDSGARGYASMYGWVQLVRCKQSKEEQAQLSETDEWEMDPIPITSDLNTPFVWFGRDPSLFDGPCRPRDLQVDWICRSFLACCGAGLIEKDVYPILGFEWGFSMYDGKVVVKPLRELEERNWNDHLDLLRVKFTGWTFHPQGGFGKRGT